MQVIRLFQLTSFNYTSSAGQYSLLDVSVLQTHTRVGAPREQIYNTLIYSTALWVRTCLWTPPLDWNISSSHRCVRLLTRLRVVRTLKYATRSRPVTLLPLISFTMRFSLLSRHGTSTCRCSLNSPSISLHKHTKTCTVQWQRWQNGNYWHTNTSRVKNIMKFIVIFSGTGCNFLWQLGPHFNNRANSLYCIKR